VARLATDNLAPDSLPQASEDGMQSTKETMSDAGIGDSKQ
jgi:hypothetical protein